MFPLSSSPLWSNSRFSVLPCEYHGPLTQHVKISAKKKRHCGFLRAANEKKLMDAAPCKPFSWLSKTSPRIARSSSSAETQSAAQGQDEIGVGAAASVRAGTRQSGLTTAGPRKWKQRLDRFFIDAKGVVDAVSRSECAGLSLADENSTVETLALRESLTRSRTRLHWPHADVNVSDGLTKFHHCAVTMLGDLSETIGVKESIRPDLHELRAQARVKEDHSRKAPPVLTSGALQLRCVSVRCNVCQQASVSFLPFLV